MWHLIALWGSLCFSLWLSRCSLYCGAKFSQVALTLVGKFMPHTECLAKWLLTLASFLPTSPSGLSLALLSAASDIGRRQRKRPIFSVEDLLLLEANFLRLSTMKMLSSPREARLLTLPSSESRTSPTFHALLRSLFSSTRQGPHSVSNVMCSPCTHVIILYNCINESTPKS
jgi:hypothetical protein